MSDLRTEIVSKVLNSWDTPTQTVASETIAQKIFNFIQQHPSATSTDVVNGTGTDLGRASATLLALYQKGKLDRRSYPNPNPDGKRDNVFAYWTAVNNYKDKGVGRVKTKKPKKLHIHKALKNLETPQMPRMETAPRMERTPIGFNPEMFVQDLSLKDARAVYELLKGYFA
jgi:hypothetical protein